MRRDEPREVDPHVASDFDRQPVVAHVETDRFCFGCGYNLRTQPVRRDAGTQLLLSRCPECGRFQPARDAATAASVWLRRLGTLTLFVWILVVLWAGVGLFAAQIGLTLAPLEELTTHGYVARQPRRLQAPATPSSQAITIGPNGTIQLSGITPALPRIPTRGRLVREQSEHDVAVILAIRGASFGTGFLLAMLAGVCMHHWRRWGYVLLVVVWSVGPALVVWYVWSHDHPHLIGWAKGYIVTQAVAFFAGGLAGVLFGRPFARVIATLILPARIRQVLAFLWLVDGKQPPGVAPAR